MMIEILSADLVSIFSLKETVLFNLGTVFSSKQCAGIGTQPVISYLTYLLLNSKHSCKVELHIPLIFTPHHH